MLFFFFEYKYKENINKFIKKKCINKVKRKKRNKNCGI